MLNCLYIFSAAAYNKLCLLVGRFLVGLGMGLEGSLHSLYVVELMSKHFRGPFVTSGVITITLGILVIYVIGSFLPWHVCMKIEYLLYLVLKKSIFVNSVYVKKNYTFFILASDC